MDMVGLLTCMEQRKILTDKGNTVVIPHYLNAGYDEMNL